MHLLKSYFSEQKFCIESPIKGIQGSTYGVVLFGTNDLLGVQIEVSCISILHPYSTINLGKIYFLAFSS